LERRRIQQDFRVHDSRGLFSKRKIRRRIWRAMCRHPTDIGKHDNPNRLFRPRRDSLQPESAAVAEDDPIIAAAY